MNEDHRVRVEVRAIHAVYTSRKSGKSFSDLMNEPGTLSVAAAVLVHEGSELLAVANGLRVRWFSWHGGLTR